MRNPCTSRIWLPLSVTNPSRNTGLPPRPCRRRLTSVRAIGMISTGSGNGTTFQTASTLVIAALTIALAYRSSLGHAGGTAGVWLKPDPGVSADWGLAEARPRSLSRLGSGFSQTPDRAEGR